MGNRRCPEQMAEFFPLILGSGKPERDLLLAHAAFGHEMRADWRLGLTEVRGTVGDLDGEARVSSRSENIGGRAAVHGDRGQ